jgi:hypothetical protein
MDSHQLIVIHGIVNQKKSMSKAANSTNGTALVFCTKHHEGQTL